MSGGLTHELSPPGRWVRELQLGRLMPSHIWVSFGSKLA